MSREEHDEGNTCKQVNYFLISLVEFIRLDQAGPCRTGLSRPMGWSMMAGVWSRYSPRTFPRIAAGAHRADHDTGFPSG